MKRLWVIGCMYVCMVSSFGLLCSAAGAPSGGAGAGAGAGRVDAREDTTDLQEYLEAHKPQPLDLVSMLEQAIRDTYLYADVNANGDVRNDTYDWSNNFENGFELFERSICKSIAPYRLPADDTLKSHIMALKTALTQEAPLQPRCRSSQRVVNTIFEQDNSTFFVSGESVYSAIPFTFKQDFRDKLMAAFRSTQDALYTLACSRADDVNTLEFYRSQGRLTYQATQAAGAADRALRDQARQQEVKDAEAAAAATAARLGAENPFVIARDAAHVEAETKKAIALKKVDNEGRLQRQANTIAAAKWLLIAGALSAVGGIGAYFGFKQLGNTRPKIIAPQDTSIGSLLKKARYPAANLDRLILTPELEVAVRQKFQGIERAIQKMLPLSNMMFFGPAGTGKTMAAQEFVRYLSGKKLVDHIIVRGPAFKQFNKTSEAISALKAIIRFAENSYKKHKRPVVIVFDEAETLFADRGQPEFSTEATRDLVTTMTSEISAAVNKHVMFILSTNFPQRIDQALLNRIDESNRIRFEAPGQKEREDLLRLYLDEALTQEGFTVSDEVMDAIPALAKSIDGMVGRQISSMVTQSIYRLLNEGEAELTLPTFQETIAATRARKDYAAY